MSNVSPLMFDASPHCRAIAIWLLCGAAVSVCLALASCSQPAEQPYHIYQVISHDPSSSAWVIDAFDIPGKTRVRWDLTCEFSSSGDHGPTNKDPSSCSFIVGEKFAWNGLGRLKSEFVDFMMIGDRHIAITRGSGADRVSQQFVVKSQRVVDYGSGP